MSTMLRAAGGAAVAGAIALAAIGCGSGGSSTGGSGGGDGAYKFGVISSESGPFQLARQRQALQLYVDQLNDAGGYNGKPIELVVADDSSDPTKSAAAARKLVQQEDVIAMVGSSSPADCPTNGAYYEAHGVASIQPAFDDACYEHELIFPLTAPASETEIPTVPWAMKKFDKTRVAYISTDAPVNRSQGVKMRKVVEQAGGELVVSEYVEPANPDVTGAIVHAKRAGAEIVAFNVFGEGFPAALKAAAQQRFGPADGVIFLASGAAYGAQIPKVLGPAGEGLYAGNPYATLESDNAEVKKLAAAMKAAHPQEPVDDFTETGWVAGIALQQVLDKVQGDLTRESFAKAASSLSSVDLKLSPKPANWAVFPHEVPNGNQIVQIEDGRWRLIADWVYS